MSATGLPVFDETVQLSHLWLDELMAERAGFRQGRSMT